GDRYRRPFPTRRSSDLMMTIFQRPSKMRNAPSTPLAAMSGVTSASLPVGAYLTFLYVLAIQAVYPYVAGIPDRNLEGAHEPALTSEEHTSELQSRVALV